MRDARDQDAAPGSGAFWEDEAAAIELDAHPLAEDHVYDLAIIGGGLTGISAALRASEIGLNTCLIEANAIGWGASGRNGGFCNVSPLKTFQGLLKSYGEVDAKAFVADQRAGVALVRSLIEQYDLKVNPVFGGTFEVAHTVKSFDALKRKADLLEKTFALKAKVLTRQAFETEGHTSPMQHGAILIDEGFVLNPLSLTRGLASAAAKQGADLHEHTSVTQIESTPDGHRVTTNRGQVRCRKLILATNGYTEDKLHDSLKARILPVVSSIIATRPLTDAEISSQGLRTMQGCSTTHGSHFYYRLLPDNRLVFGGPGDATGKDRDITSAYAALHKRIKEFFPNLADVELTHRWRGSVATTLRFAPSVGQSPTDPSILFGFGYQGNGVAAATWTGRRLADVAAERQTLNTGVAPPIQGLPPKIPLPQLRPFYARAAYAALKLKD